MFVFVLFVFLYSIYSIIVKLRQVLHTFALVSNIKLYIPVVLISYRIKYLQVKCNFVTLQFNALLSGFEYLAFLPISKITNSFEAFVKKFEENTYSKVITNLDCSFLINIGEV